MLKLTYGPLVQVKKSGQQDSKIKKKNLINMSNNKILFWYLHVVYIVTKSTLMAKVPKCTLLFLFLY